MKSYMYGLMVAVSIIGTAVYGNQKTERECPAELTVADLTNLSKAGEIDDPKNTKQTLILKSVNLSPALEKKYDDQKTNADSAQHKMKMMLPKSWQVVSKGVFTEGRAKAERTLTNTSAEDGKTQCEYKFADLLDKGARRGDSKFTVEIK